MKTPTVIHLTGHTIVNRPDYYFDGWASRTAQKISQYSPGYRHECWYAINNIKKPKTIKKDGIIYRLFPAFTLNPALESFFGIVYSPTLTQKLRQISKQPNTLFHLQGERGLLVWQIINILKGKPIFLQFHGYRGTPLLRPIEKLFVETGEKYFFQFIDYFFVHFNARIDYLKQVCHIPSSKILFQNVGADYQLFTPIGKIKAKKDLGIPIDKKVILYVGLYNQTKGVKHVIQAHLNLKSKFNTFLILIGGHQTDPFYNYASQHADMILERIPHQNLPIYYSAADVYCMICPPVKRPFGGLGVSSMESLACNTPILNSNINDAPAAIKNKIGFFAGTTTDLIKNMKFIFSHPHHFTNLRDISKPYFSWPSIIRNILKSYQASQNKSRS